MNIAGFLVKVDDILYTWLLIYMLAAAGYSFRSEPDLYR